MEQLQGTTAELVCFRWSDVAEGRTAPEEEPPAEAPAAPPTAVPAEAAGGKVAAPDAAAAAREAAGVDETEEGMHFTVVLRRASADEKWGLGVDMRTGVLAGVKEGTVAGRWNEEQLRSGSELELRQSDQVLSINGVEGGDGKPEGEKFWLEALHGLRVELGCFRWSEQDLAQEQSGADSGGAAGVAILPEGIWSPAGEGLAGWCITLTLTRPSSATKWGFLWVKDFLQEDQIRVIDNVDPGSPLDEWNRNQERIAGSVDEAHTVDSGDRLVQVNGVQETNGEAVKAELQTNKIICVFFREEEEEDQAREVI